MKTCTRCAQVKPLDLFYLKKHGKFGVMGRCRACIIDQSSASHSLNRTRNVIRMRDYRLRTLEKQQENDRARYAENPEHRLATVRKWRQENPEAMSLSQARWAIQNRGRKYAIGAKRRAAKLNACPSWLTEEHHLQIREIYATCPKGYHVDHEVPLQGKNVCGLHVPWNLQHLPAVENLKKGVKCA